MIIGMGIGCAQTTTAPMPTTVVTDTGPSDEAILGAVKHYMATVRFPHGKFIDCVIVASQRGTQKRDASWPVRVQVRSIYSKDFYGKGVRLNEERVFDFFIGLNDFGQWRYHDGDWGWKQIPNVPGAPQASAPAMTTVPAPPEGPDDGVVNATVKWYVKEHRLGYRALDMRINTYERGQYNDRERYWAIRATVYEKWTQDDGHGPYPKEQTEALTFWFRKSDFGDWEFRCETLFSSWMRAKS